MAGSRRRCCRGLTSVHSVGMLVFVVGQLLVLGLLLHGGLPSGGGGGGEGCDCQSQQEPSDDKQDPGLSSPATPPPSKQPPPPHLRPLQPQDQPAWGHHRLAVVVPFRDRLEEMLEFVPHLHAFLDAQRVRHKLFIVNQMDNLRFNRAALINVGFLLAEEECDYFAMHDVDLLPVNPELSYAYPARGPFHVAAPDLHPKYHYATFVGGILLLSNSHMRQINGMSNNYWGWGKEDDEFYVRMMEANLTVSRPTNITTAYHTFRHIHEKRRRPRDNRRYYDQKVKSRQRDRLSGLRNVRYVVDSARELSIEGAPATILNVRLHCDLNVTPWCITPTQMEEISTYLRARTAEAEAPNEPVELVNGQPRKTTPLPVPSVELSDLVLLKSWSVNL